MKILKNRLAVGVICIVLAIAIGFLAVPILLSVTNQKIEVIVASQNIAKGTKIDESMLRAFEMFSSDIPGGADLKYSDVVGTYALVDIQESDVIFTGKFSKEFPYADEMLYSIPANMFAVSVSVESLAQSVASKIRANDVVTVLVNIHGKSNPGEVNNASTFPELMYMRVLGVTTANGEDISIEKEEIIDSNNSNSSTLSVVTLLCNLEQAQMLAGFENNDTIHLALVARGNSELAEEYLYRQQELFDIREAEARWEEERARLEEEARIAEEQAQREKEAQEEAARIAAEQAAQQEQNQGEEGQTEETPTDGA